MRRIVRVSQFALVAAALAATPTLAYALRVALPGPPPVQQRLVNHDTIIIGKVTSIEAKTVMAEPYPKAQNRVEYKVAVIKVEEAITGAKGLTHVKVAWVPAPAQDPKGDPNQPIRIRPPVRVQPVNLTEGQEALFYLSAHHKETFYVVANSFDVVDKKAANFKTDLESLKKYSKILADPAAAMKSKDAQERLDAAGLLLMRYRTQRPGQTRQVPIDARETRQIIDILLNAEWEIQPRVYNPFAAQNLFYQLDPYSQGFKPPRDFRQFPAEAKKWLKDNADKVKIQKWVSDESK